MNGKTDENPINIYSCELDRHTYGCSLFNVTTWGNRIVRAGLFGAWIDVFWAGWRRPRYMRLVAGGSLSWPLGLIFWPLPRLKERAK